MVGARGIEPPLPLGEAGLQPAGVSQFPHNAHMLFMAGTSVTLVVRLAGVCKFCAGDVAVAHGTQSLLRLELDVQERTLCFSAGVRDVAAGHLLVSTIREGRYNRFWFRQQLLFVILWH